MHQLGIYFDQRLIVFDLLIYLRKELFSFTYLLTQLVYLLLVLPGVEKFIVLAGFLLKLYLFVQQVALPLMDAVTTYGSIISRVEAATIHQLPDALRQAQAVFDRTGGLQPDCTILLDVSVDVREQNAQQ